jgi:hypothetical protein
MGFRYEAAIHGGSRLTCTASHVVPLNLHIVTHVHSLCS